MISSQRLSAKPLLARGCRILNDEPYDLILIPEGFVRLNETAAHLIRCCDGQKSLRDILSQLQIEYKTSPERMMADIENFIEGLLERKVLVLL